MIRRYLAAALTVTAAIAAGAAMALIPRLDVLAAPPALQAEKASLPEPSDAPPELSAPSPSQPEEAAGYLLGEYGGRVSVLSPATREPEMIFDIFVRTLPDADQELLREGIRVETYEELTRLIEDYIS